MRTIPFKTATPKRAIKPTPADILKGIPLSSKANTPPIADIGIAVKIKIASLIEPKNSVPRSNHKKSSLIEAGNAG